MCSTKGNFLNPMCSIGLEDGEGTQRSRHTGIPENLKVTSVSPLATTYQHLRYRR